MWLFSFLPNFLSLFAHTQIVGKLLTKSKQNKVSLTHLYKCKFVLWQKEKRNIGIFTAKLTILCYDQKPTSLQGNGMAAIPKSLFMPFSYFRLILKHERLYVRCTINIVGRKYIFWVEPIHKMLICQLCEISYFNKIVYFSSAPKIVLF